ncbi:MAG: Asp-tRNA(Asn)/Glu-tRNA(Gln) amidotransferase subunit GatA [Anaerolineaceae bacterium]|nr:Asp-tRNA(Asn)/Glu-tRNA(Gln) amidotransferase subunit GatA [Anaerolineaceae bacterium]MCB9101734.1 Asp-tRNA(Asn)/Glu-tRNA(Gln) amidotransferase subunit GatA [Anaerolineales bacterium]
MLELYSLTIHEAQAKLRQGEISSVELTESVLERIDAVEAKVGAYISLQPELALRMAEMADERRAAGEDRPLLGIPLGIKDTIITHGVPTTAASKILDGFIPPFDATAIDRLRQAGAVFVGKTNCDEFAMGSSTEYSAFHPTRNPRNLNCVPGGSSGGSAAAVGAGEALGSLGSDTGGSVRLPASFCGVVGLKPTYGRVSRYGLIAFGSSLDQIGPITKDVEDAAILLNAIAGHDARDATSLNAPVPNYAEEIKQGDDLKGIKVGIPQEYFTEGMEPGVAQTVRAAIDHLAGLGAEPVEVSLPNTGYGIPAYYIVATAEASANLSRYDGVRFGLRQDGGDMWNTFRQTREAGFGPEVKRRIMLGTYALSAGYYDAYYLQAQKVRTLLRQDFERAFEQVDVMVSPVAPMVAFEINAKVDDPLQMYLTDVLTVSLNLAGVCGISVPCGFSEGMPVGLQIIGPALGESAILRTAYQYEQTTAWHKQPAVL